jgi:hypothetical protein
MRHASYLASPGHVGLVNASSLVQTQVPPEEERTEAYAISKNYRSCTRKLTLTAIIYAIVKNVVSPALTSVTNLEPFRSLGCELSVLKDWGI